MSNQAGYEKLRIRLKRLEFLMDQVLTHLGLQAPPLAEQGEFREAGRTTDVRSIGQFGGGASMRNTRPPTRVPQQDRLRPTTEVKRSTSKLGKTVGQDGTVMSVRQVSPGNPRAGRQFPIAQQPQPVAPAQPAAVVGEPVSPQAGNLTELLAGAASIVDALGAALASFGVAQPPQPPADPEMTAYREAVEQSEQAQPVDPSAEDWMTAEGVNAGPVVDTQ